MTIFASKQTVFLFLMLAVLVRSFIPVGFMPESGKIGITICSGMEIKTIYVDAEPESDSHKKENPTSSSCPFALPPVSDVPPAFNIAEFLSVFYMAPVSVWNEAGIGYFHLPKSYLSQGPPEIFVV